MPLIDDSQDLASRVAMMSAVSCQDQPCFIHQTYYLHKSQYRVCSCGEKTDLFEFDRNLFAESVNMHELMLEIDDIAMQILESSQKSEKKNKKKKSYTVVDLCQ